MAEWLYEAGIGEARAALVADGTIIAAAIERDDGSPRAGAILSARLVRQQVAGRRGLVLLAGGAEALLEPLPPGLSEGGTTRVEIVREAIAEPGHPKRARARPATDPERPGATLAERLADAGVPLVGLAVHGPDRLEAAGWSELLDEATTGAIAFPGGALRMALTPAMTLFDVDGVLPPAELARAGAAAAARAIQRMDIGGSIGIDLPTVNAKADRLAAAAAFDALLPPPFERTAVNGFGFLQVVRRRTRASLPELLQHDPLTAAALALLRRAERVRGAGMRTISAAPAVIARIETAWIAELSRRIGAPVTLRGDAARAISAGDVHAEHPSP